MIINADIHATWARLAAILPKTAFPIMDKDHTLWAYFLVYKGVNKKLTQHSPILQLTLSQNGKTTHLHLITANNMPAKTAIVHQFYQAIKKEFMT